MPRFAKHPAFGPALVAAITLAATLLTLGPATTGPGVTCDEYYDTAAGKSLVRSWRTHGWQFFTAPVIHATFDSLTKHPPLGRWLLGWAHAPFDPQPDEPFLVWLPGGRLASALEFALLVMIVGWATARSAGPAAGTGAAAALATMPRSFGHAHFATLDTPMSLFFVLAVLALARAARPEQRWTAVAGAGIVAGLAMATKIHGVLLLPVATIMLVGYGRWWGIARLALWSVVAGAVFFASWPWLWVAPVERTLEFFLTATDRLSLYTYYLDQAWPDRDVPWHYPWVMFAVVQPVGWLVLGATGLWARRRRLLHEPLATAALTGLVVTLGIFSLPAVPVYDGVRLFLMAFPLWAIFVGVGISRLMAWVVDAHRGRTWRGAVVASVLLAQGWGVINMHPYQLSYYSAAVGGLAGAERLGFEISYWGDAIARPIVEATVREAPDQAVYYAPHLAPFQADSVQVAVPALNEAGIMLVGELDFDADAHFALVYRRRANLETIEEYLDILGAEVVAEESRHGVWLARLYRLPELPRRRAPGRARESP